MKKPMVGSQEEYDLIIATTKPATPERDRALHKHYAIDRAMRSPKRAYELVLYDGKPVCVMIKNSQFNGVDVGQAISPDEGVADVVRVTAAQVQALMAGKKADLPPHLIVCSKCYNEFKGHTEKVCPDCKEGKK